MNSMFTLSLHKLQEELLVAVPILDDVSHWWEESTEKDVVVIVIVPLVSHIEVVLGF